jgi:hypothetical protein
MLSPEDTYLGLNATANGAADTLATYTWPDFQVANAIVLKFDLSKLPPGAIIQQASLELSLVGSDGASDPSYTVSAHKLTKKAVLAKATGYTADGVSAWTGSGCCYDGIPLAQGDLSQAYTTRAVDQAPGVKTWDITDIARDWLHDPAANFGVVLNSDATKPKDRFRYFASSEHANTSLRPVLRVTYQAPDATPPQVVITAPAAGQIGGTVQLSATATDNVGVAGVQFFLNGAAITPELSAWAATSWDTTAVSDGTYALSAVARDWAGLTATSPVLSVTVRNGVLRLSPEDTYLDLNTRNHSQLARVTAYTWPDRRAANAIVMRFNLASMPAGATIQEARLFLALVDSDKTKDTGYVVSAHKLKKNAVVSKATGYSADGAAGWTANSCCHKNIPLAQADILPAADAPLVNKQPGFKSWNVTSMVRDWLTDPASNRGLLLNADTTRLRDRYRSFASMQHSNSGLRPYLRITYTLPAPPPPPAADTTAPTVAVSAPIAGATVSGTVSLTATASDNIGVTAVQFQVNGSSVGAEDASAPYSYAWNTTSVSNASYTITARARDAAGNVRTSAGITVTVSNTSSGAGGGGTEPTIASAYPGDANIESHPDVVFVERFEDTSLSTTFGRWTDVLNGAGMRIAGDVPAGSPGSRSLNIPWVGGVSTGGHLYKLLNPGVDDVLYVRYYIKYPSAGKYQHTGVWMGGYNPAISWPNPQAGSKPAGNDRFIAAAEQNTQTNRFDHYNYWMNMRPSSDGRYWGNLLLNNASVQATAGGWTCVEQMVKLNNPVSDSNGEHAIWLNGVKVSHLGKGFPNGTWSGGVFTQSSSGTPFEGFRWRSDANLKLNWIWLQNYASADPAGFAGDMLFDHLIVARKRIGCLAAGAAPAADTTAPSVSVSAPAAGATVSGTAVTVSAAASDNVGVAAVQFKLDGANLGAEDTSSPYSLSWNTTGVSNGTHTLTAVARDAAGNITTSAGRTLSVNNASVPSGAAWPNEPSGFSALSDQPWTSMTAAGWNYLRRSSSKDDTIMSDPATPLSPSQLLRIIFTPDMPRDTGPSVHWIGLPSRPREMFTGWWMKLSPNWSASPAGGGKITFAWATNGQGQVYSNIGGSAAPHRININTEWAPYGQKFWEPNVTTTPITYSQWYRIEWYLKWESTPGASDGVMKWWVNGVLNGDYRNVRFPTNCCFEQFEYAPTRQNSPLSEEYMFIDHTRVSAP